MHVEPEEDWDGLQRLESVTADMRNQSTSIIRSQSNNQTKSVQHSYRIPSIDTFICSNTTVLTSPHSTNIIPQITKVPVTLHSPAR